MYVGLVLITWGVCMHVYGGGGKWGVTVLCMTVYMHAFTIVQLTRSACLTHAALHRCFSREISYCKLHCDHYD